MHIFFWVLLVIYTEMQILPLQVVDINGKQQIGDGKHTDRYYFGALCHRKTVRGFVGGSGLN